MAKRRKVAVQKTQRAHRSFAVAALPIALIAPTVAFGQATPALPNPCQANVVVCGSGRGWDPLRTGSTLSVNPAGTALTINQSATSAIFNWQSFNIGVGNSVTFVQPSTSSVALNRIYDVNRTSIDGSLKANGQLYLINPNGILFGNNARVDVGGLIAATLNVTDERVTRGLLSDPNRSNPVLFADPNLAPIAGNVDANTIRILPGAQIYAAGRNESGTVVSAGRVFLFAPDVSNAGTIKVDGGGQVIAAAGSKVYLGSSADATLRGLLVEVSDGLSVSNSGAISASRGNVTLMGLAVNQMGTLSATSAIRENGSIRLVAREVALDSLTNGRAANVGTALFAAAKTGTVRIGSGSRTVVSLEASDTGTAPLNDSFAGAARSSVVVEGGRVDIGGAAGASAGSTLIEARGGDVEITARGDLTTPSYSYGDQTPTTPFTAPALLGRETAGAVVNVGADVKIDVSGLHDVTVDGARNFVYIDRLTTNDMRDAPFQRDGFLKGKGVFMNVAVDHPFIDNTNRRAAVVGGQAERNATGGRIALRAEDAVNVQRGAVLDVSGGTTRTTDAVGRTSQLVSADGRVFDIMQAPANLRYIGFADSLSQQYVSVRDGVSSNQQFSAPRFTRIAGMTEGKSAGSVEIYAPRGRLDGTLIGQTTPSAKQRNALPAGGELRIGSSTFGPGAIDQQAYISRASVALGDGTTIAPGAEPGRTIAVNADQLVRNGFRRFSITSDGRVDVLAGAPLALGPGGTLDVAANAVSVQANVSAPGGRISLVERPLSLIRGDGGEVGDRVKMRDELNRVPAEERGSIRIGQGVQLNVAGTWTNDALVAPDRVATAPVVLNGGSIEISGRKVDVSGASFDVSSGATLSRAGSFSGGAGGSLAISASDRPIPATIDTPDNGSLILGSDFASRIAGFGVQSGGSLSIRAPREIVIDRTGEGSTSSRTVLSPAVGERGFQQFSFSAFNAAGVAGGTVFAPRPQVLAFSDPLRLTASTDTLRSVLAPTAPAPGTTRAVRVNLASSSVLDGRTAVGTGATVDAGIGGSVSLSGGSQVVIDGALRALGGTISASIGALNNQLSSEAVSQRRVELGSAAVIDASGASRIIESANGTRTGDVLDGGTVSLGGSGFIVSRPGSRIDVRGTTDTLTVGQGTGVQTREVATRGGVVTIATDMGAFVQGEIKATGGSSQVEGGRLNVRLTVPPDTLLSTSAQPWGTGPREVRVGGTPAELPATSSTAFDVTAAGRAQISAAQINDGGFDHVSLAGADRISFAAGTRLQPRSTLGLDALAFTTDAGAPVVLSSAYVALGAATGAASRRQASTNFQPPEASTGQGELVVRGQHIDLMGTSVLQNIGNATLVAERDVRTVGTAPGDTQVGTPDAFNRPAGALTFAGNLTVEAQQLTAASFTAFTIASNAAPADTAAGRFTLRQASGTPTAPLSAAGGLTISAPEVLVDGRISAPHGSIDINAGRTLNMTPRAVLSVAGTEVVPLGSVFNGARWTYNGGTGITTFASATTATLPDKRISLTSPRLDAAPGARLSGSGGGDIRATEFIPGPGGSRDVSSNFPDPDNAAGRNTLFALVPTRGDTIAPFDPQILNGLRIDTSATAATAFRFGQTITIGAGSGIPPGTYTILPARYALLPNAYAVQPVAGYADLSPTRGVQEATGTVVVAGRLGYGTNGPAQDRWAGFRVFTGEQFRQLAEYRDYSADTFIAAAARAQEVSSPRLPADAASVSIAANTIRLAAELDVRAAAGGRGAEIALSADRISVGNGAPSLPPSADSTLSLDANALSALKAETLVLGAAVRRQSQGTSVALSNVANEVEVAGGATLSAGEVVLAASKRVSVRDGASIDATASTPGPATRSITVEGDGAALWSSAAANAQLKVTRSNASAAGTAVDGVLQLGPGSRVAGRTVLFDASKDQTFDAGFTLQADSAILSAAAINLGEVPAGVTGLNITAALLTQFGSAGRLGLTSTSGFNAYGAATLGQLDAQGRPSLAQLTLNGPGVRNAGGTAGTVTLNAGKVVLSNASGTALPTGGGGGSIAINAIGDGKRTDGSIDLVGAIALSGFDRVNLRADGSAALAVTGAVPGAVRFRGPVAATASLDAGTADVRIESARVTAERGVRASLVTAGQLTLASSGPAPGATPAEFGASLNVRARAIDVGGRIDLPAGSLVLEANGASAADGVTMHSGSVINVAGQRRVIGPTDTDVFRADVSAGSVQVSSANGSIVQQAGGTIDLSGAGRDGDAGQLGLRALTGEVRLQGSVIATRGTQARGAEISIAANRLDNTSEIAGALGNGAVTHEAVALRAVRGDVNIGATDTLKAESISIAADGAAGPLDGNVSVAGRLIANAEQGGRIAIDARNQVRVASTGVLEARADGSASNRDGGRIALSGRVTNNSGAPATLDGVVLEQGARVDVSAQGGEQGQLLLRSRRSGNDVAVAAVADGAVTGGRTIVEGVVLSEHTTNLVLNPGTAASAVNPLPTLRTTLSNYMTAANMNAMRSRIGNVEVRPGLEIRTTGDLTVAGPLDFSQGISDAVTGAGNFVWRYGNTTNLTTSAPGALTLRAGGNVAINASVNDGFRGVTPAGQLYGVRADSWRLQFTAGAELQAAAATQTNSARVGNLSVGSGAADTLVRTGTGSIGLNAGGNINLRNSATRQGTVVYSAGAVLPTQPVFPTTTGSIRPLITTGGGDVTLAAGGAVNGADATHSFGGSRQQVNEWLYRGGFATQESPQVYWVNFAQFQQGVGALGGGNTRVRAGTDIVKLGAVVAGAGWSDGTAATKYNAGSLDVAAGGTIRQGLYYNDSGRLDVRATRIEGSAPGEPVAVENLVTRLAQGANHARVQARESANVRLPFNPTAAYASLLNFNLIGPDYRTAFVTTSDQTRASVRVAAGDLTFGGGLRRGPSGSQLANEAGLNAAIAPNVDIVAFGGSVTGRGAGESLATLPQADSSIRILADKDIQQVVLAQSDSDPAAVPRFGSGSLVISTIGPQFLATPRSSPRPLHADDASPSVVVARTGSLRELNYFTFAETSEVHAGQSITGEFDLQVQNNGEGSLTRVTAGRAIDLGTLSGGGTPTWIRIYGKGAAEIIAGGPVNLGTNRKSGILSRGNLQNGSLPPEGASLIVMAGVGADEATGFAVRPDYANVLRQFVASDAFAAAGADAAKLNTEVIGALRAKGWSDIADLLAVGLANRGTAVDSASTFNQALGKLPAARLSEGALRLMTTVQQVANRRFVATRNTDTFAPGYAGFADLLPRQLNGEAAVRQFIRDNPFASAGNGDALREQALNGIDPSLAAVIRLGLSTPSSIDDPSSAFGRALAALAPETLSQGTRQLLSNTLTVAGKELDTLRAANRFDAASGTPFASGLTDFAASFAVTGLSGANDLSLTYSQIKAEQTGSVIAVTPRGAIAVGQSSPPPNVDEKVASELGMFTAGGGDIIGVARDNVDVFRSRVFTIAGGDITLWSSSGNIDAGRGPRDVVVAPPPRLVLDPITGQLRLDVGAAVAGSGIGALKTSEGQGASNIALIAPKGFIDAGEAGIRAESGTVTLGTNIVLNAGNIQAASGVSGGAVVAAPPAPVPTNATGGQADRALDEAQRNAAAQQQEAERRAAEERRRRVTGEFLGFGDD